VVPAPRGTVVDRNGGILAIDCETYEVRAQISVPSSAADAAAYRRYLDEVAAELATAMVADPDLADRAVSRDQQLKWVHARLAEAFHLAELPQRGPVPASHPRVADVRIAGDVDALSVVEALRALDERRRLVTMHFLRSYRRAHPHRESTYGIVGHVTTLLEKQPDATPVLRTFGVCGLESLAALSPDAPSSRRYLKDGNGLPYFVAPLGDVRGPNVLHSTIDLELQREAVRLLAAQAEKVAEGARQPKWGALVLVEIESGDVLAAAAWHRGEKHPEASAFTPFQSLFEPGSIVKPLVLAYALEAGALDWSHQFDCAPGSADYRERISSLGSRVVRDDHHCDVLTPHGIIVNSSNIGAAYVGLQLERPQWRDYMRFFGFGTSLGLGLPGERKGGTDPQSFNESTPLRSFRRNSAISFSFGYELQVTAMHVARAYLRLFRGAGAQLRVCRGVEIGGQWHAAPAPRDAGPQLRPEVIEAVRAAMVDVVSADPHATGYVMHGRMLKETGIDLHGLVAGKTGTAASRIGIPGRGKVEVRNASFVGVLPAESPRWLAVCVLQKDDSARFYGGSYAAPPAVRLLLQCESLEHRRRWQQEPQVSAGGQVRATGGPPGDSGWGRGAPETTSAGR
jgi:cell division protein FtsI/penicillin-binding protein 2